MHPLTIDDLGVDVLKIIIRLAGPHYITGVSKRWRQVAKTLIEERLRHIKERRSYYWGSSHVDFLEAAKYPNTNITTMHRMLDRFVYHHPMFTDYVKMLDFRRPIRKCLDGVFAYGKRKYRSYPSNVLALLDATIVYFSLTKILRKLQPKYNGISPKLTTRGYYTDTNFFPRLWLEKHNTMDIIAFLLLEDNYPPYTNKCIIEVLDSLDEGKKKIIAVVLVAWISHTPITAKVYNSLHAIAGTMGNYPYCQRYINNFLSSYK